MTLIRIPMYGFYDLTVLGSGLQTHLIEYEGQNGPTNEAGVLYETVVFKHLSRFTEQAEDVGAPRLIQTFEKWLRVIESTAGVTGIEWRIRPTIEIYHFEIDYDGKIWKWKNWLPLVFFKPVVAQLRFRYALRYDTVAAEKITA